MRRTEESISSQCNHQVPSTVNGTRKLAAGQDKEKTQKRHRKDTEKTQKRHKKKDKQFFQRRSQVWVTNVTPTRGSSFFYWFQTSPAEVRPRSQTLPLMSCSPVRAIQNLYFFSTKSLQKIDICPPKKLICYYNTSIQKPRQVLLFSKRVKAIFSFLKKNLRKKKHKNQRNVP